MTTNPGKKGYGGSTPGTLFGPGPTKGAKSATGKEYEHLPEPYDLARQFERSERKFKQELLGDKKPCALPPQQPATCLQTILQPD